MSSKHHDPDICTCIDCWTTPDHPTPSPAPASGAEKSLVRRNREADPTYAPYCFRCSTMARMREVEPFLWECRAGCGAVHDERTPTPPSDAGPRERETCDDCNNLRAPLCLAHGCIIAAPAAEGPQDGPNWRTLAGALIHTAKDGPDGAVIVGGDEYVALCAAYAEPIQFSRHQPPAASAAEGPREEWTTCTLDGGVVYAFHHPCRRAFVVQQEHDCTPSERASA